MLHPSRFVVDGHSFIAVPQRSRDCAGRDDCAIEQGAIVVGRIAWSGRRYLVYDAKQAVAARSDALSVAEILTKRELQVALLIGEGKCDKEIARNLGISGYTVREHIRRIFAKLKIGRRSAIVACVLR
jgi:DNA-binding CsgD family transcriptional regulator